MLSRRVYATKRNMHYLITKANTSTTPDTKSAVQTPNAKKITTDMIGPVDPVSNLRKIIFKQPPDETKLEKLYREKRAETQEWNQEFWTHHNSRFFQGKEEFLKKNLPEGKQSLTADEMSVFYKDLLDKNWKEHVNYNVEWYKRNITLLSLALRDFPVTKYRKNEYFTNSSIAKKSKIYTSGSKYTKLRNNVSKHKVIESANFYYAMFLAAAVVFAMVNHKSKLFFFTKNNIVKMNIKSHINKLESVSKFSFFNVTPIYNVATRGCLSISQKVGKSMASCFFRRSSSSFNNTWVYITLIKRLEDIVEEKNRLGQLLSTSIQENKNLKTRNHLEIMTRNRLMKLIEDAQTHLKDFKTRIANLQNLNTNTHQENISLKARINKLKREKLETDQNLTTIVRKIYDYNNKELMNFCDKVLNKDNLQNLEIRNEIRKFLEKPRTPSADTTETFGVLFPTSSKTALQPKIMRSDGDRVVPFVSMKPNCHHGEYLWTVKDSDGLIERIYEYDNFDSDYDNGDMIRRIREYSVFCNKDCVLDGKSSRTILNERSDLIQLKIADQKFLTGSEAFQTFLRNNKRFVATASPPPSPRRSGDNLICG